MTNISLFRLFSIKFDKTKADFRKFSIQEAYKLIDSGEIGRIDKQEK